MNSLQAFSLSGRRALVTGSSQGIGLTLARGLAEAGAAVILNSRKEDALLAAVEELLHAGHLVEGAAFDVTDEAQVKEGIEKLQAGRRKIDILVNNVGIHRRGPLAAMSLADWKTVIDTNLTSAFLMGRAVAPGMIERKSGKIVNICSLMSDLARPTTGNYAAAKGGLRMLTRAMCAEWAKENVQINGIAPGYILTELTRPLADDPKFDTWIKSRTPAGRWGSTSDLVGACVFLCSSASDFINGQLLTIDGGLSAVI